MRVINNNKDTIDFIKNFIVTKIWIWIVLLIFLYLFNKSLINQNIYFSLYIAISPLLIILFFIIISNSEKGFYPIFISHFLLLSISSFIDLKLGVSTVIITMIIFVSIILKRIYNKLEWKHTVNPMLWVYIIWTIYCILEIANPNHVQEAWNVAITQYAIYPLVCAILVPLSIKNKNQIHWLLVIWSIFVIFASFKGYWQKNHGFNERELYFLYQLGGAKTHLIWSGIRYFSVFTDAANYGVHMGMAVTGFAISSLYTKSKSLKCYYLLIAFFALFGLFISGTRAAIAVPIVGVFLFTILSGNIKFFSLGATICFLTIIFFNYTTIGDDNLNIRRMRTAFNPTKDASFQVRKENQKQLKILMSAKPFGYGIGLGGKTEKYQSKEQVPYPPDSWIVNVWMDSGIIGVIIYIFIHSFLFVYCSWRLVYKIDNFRIKGLLSAWLCVNLGYFVASFANDVMQYPNSIIVYTGFALCVTFPSLSESNNKKKLKTKIYNDI